MIKATSPRTTRGLLFCATSIGGLVNSPPAETADAIAMKLGIEKTAMIRVRAGISYALTEAMDEGHRGLPKDELVPLAEKLLEVPQELIRAALDPSAETRSRRGTSDPRSPPVYVRIPDAGAGAAADRLAVDRRRVVVGAAVVLDRDGPVDLVPLDHRQPEGADEGRLGLGERRVKLKRRWGPSLDLLSRLGEHPQAMLLRD
jgi:Helix-hairpin-helix containing domain